MGPYTNAENEQTTAIIAVNQFIIQCA
jgi:hypothetical protein